MLLCLEKGVPIHGSSEVCPPPFLNNDYLKKCGIMHTEITFRSRRTGNESTGFAKRIKKPDYQ